jgi:hypothetical protein
MSYTLFLQMIIAVPESASPAHARLETGQQSRSSISKSATALGSVFGFHRSAIRANGKHPRSTKDRKIDCGDLE